MTASRRGLLAGGNFIVDRVKTIDHYPAQDTLATILRESHSNGGGPYNVLKDLAAMRVDYPLEAVGLVGEDAGGDWIIKDCETSGICTNQLQRSGQAATSYTDVMSCAKSGRRTFFHQRGTNAFLDLQHFDFSRSRARLFHFGYPMLLDRFDRFDSDGVCPAATLLRRARAAGFETSVDFVSTPHPEFQAIAHAILPQVDHLLLNEIEAGMILELKLDPSDRTALGEAAALLLNKGVNQSVVIHFEGGAVAIAPNRKLIYQPSLNLPPGYGQGATGAGDAFAAGYLHGVHEDAPMDARLRLAMCTAAASLAHPEPSAGLRPTAECLALANAYPWRLAD
jgi:sugar/nucleoside kinase (ribokinase family)